MLRRRTNTYPAVIRKSLPDEVIPGLYIGGTESAAHLPALLHRKIKVIVQLVVESEQHFPDQFDYLTYKISDHPTSVRTAHVPASLVALT